MKKVERILDNLEKAIGGLLIWLAGVISYLFINFDGLSKLQIIAATAGIFTIFVILIIFCIAYHKNFQNLKE